MAGVRLAFAGLLLGGLLQPIDARATDADLDGVPDTQDNCVNDPNPIVLERLPWMTTTGGQRDDDADGYGNVCDADFDNSLAVAGGPDITMYSRAIGQLVSSNACGEPGEHAPCARFDLTDDQVVIGGPDTTRINALSGWLVGPRCADCGDFTILPCVGPACPRTNDALQVSADGHYVEFRGKTKLLVGDSGTQVVPQNPNIDYQAWIDSLSAEGVNAIHVWAIKSPQQNAFSVPPLTENRYGYIYPGLTPWARFASGPVAEDGLPQWDLLTFDPVYWTRLRNIVQYADARDMVVGISVFFGWPKDISWPFHPFKIGNGGPLSGNHRINLLDTPGTEILTQTFSPSWDVQKQNQWYWETYADKLLQETNSFGNTFYVYKDEHSYREGANDTATGTHFADFFRSRGALWVDHEAQRANVDMVYEQRFPTPETLFNTTPAAPIMEFEDGDESLPGSYAGTQVRHRIWNFAISGGHYFFHNDQNQEDVYTGVMIYDPNVISPGFPANVHERERWLGAAARFFNEQVNDLSLMEPHDEVVSSARALARLGSEYAIYVESASQFSLDLTAEAGLFSGTWYDPETGVASPGTIHDGGLIHVIPTPGAGDWAYHLVKLSCVSVPEVCNLVDDDCHGVVDNGILPEPNTCDEGVCATTGEFICTGAGEIDTCTPLPPTNQRT